jgi:hypothetical protein
MVFSAARDGAAPRRTQRTENLDHYSIVKDRRLSPRLDLSWVECPREGVRETQHDSNAAKRTRLVELIGIEPTTSGLQNPRSPS